RLRNPRPDHFLFVLRKHADDSVDCFRRVDRVQRRKHQMPRFRSLECDFDRLTIAHFTDEYDFRRLPQRGTKRDGEAGRVRVKLALVDRGVLVRVQKLDRIFDRDDVVVVNLVNQVDDRCQSRTLTAASWSSHQHDSVFDIYYLFQYFRQIEITKARRSHRYHAHDDRVCAALFEDVDAETRVAGHTERQVGRTR